MDLSLKPFIHQQRPRVVVVCIACGSDNVWTDAAVRWDVDVQRFEVTERYGNLGWCECCDSETSLKQIPLNSTRSERPS